MGRTGKKIMAFTLVELLVVIAVIVVLMGLLLPALSSVKSKAQDIYCVNSSKQIAIGVSCYANDFNGFGPIEQWRSTIRDSWEYSRLSYCWNSGDWFIGHLFVKPAYFSANTVECPMRKQLGGNGGLHSPETFHASNYGKAGKVFNAGFEIKGSSTSIPSASYDVDKCKDFPWRLGASPEIPMVWGRIYRSIDDFVHKTGAPVAYEDCSAIFANVKDKTIVKFSSYDIGHAEAKISWIKNDVCRGGNFLK